MIPNFPRHFPERALMVPTTRPAPLFPNQGLRESLSSPPHRGLRVGLSWFLLPSSPRSLSGSRLLHRILTARCPSESWRSLSHRLRGQAELCESGGSCLIQGTS